MELNEDLYISIPEEKREKFDSVLGRDDEYSTMEDEDYEDLD